jgi:hypothetical protein
MNGQVPRTFHRDPRHPKSWRIKEIWARLDQIKKELHQLSFYAPSDQEERLRSEQEQLRGQLRGLDFTDSRRRQIVARLETIKKELDDPDCRKPSQEEQLQSEEEQLWDELDWLQTPQVGDCVAIVNNYMLTYVVVAGVRPVVETPVRAPGESLKAYMTRANWTPTKYMIKIKGVDGIVRTAFSDNRDGPWSLQT